MRVTNIALDLVTTWDMSKFESCLQQMKEIYQTRGSESSLAEQGVSSPACSEDPFNNSSDGWAPSPPRSVGCGAMGIAGYMEMGRICIVNVFVSQNIPA